MAVNREPLISVIIPVYNRRKELQRCLSSLKNQDFKEEFEVIVVDDGSCISLDKIVENFKEFLDISLIRIENSGGPAKPRNIGARMAKGKWLSFLDCDDTWNSNRLSVLSKKLKNFQKGVLYHKLKIIKENKYSFSFKRSVGDKIFMDPLNQFYYCGNPVPNSSVVIDKKSFFILDGFDESINLKAYEDFDLWIRAARNSLPFLFISKKLGNYHVSIDSISKISHEIINGQRYFYKKHKSNNSMNIKSIQSYRRYNLAVLYLDRHDYKKRALTLLKHSENVYLFKHKLSRLFKIIKLLVD